MAATARAKNTESADLTSLLRQREELDRQIESLKEEKRGEIIKQIEELAASIGETPQTLFGGRGRRSGSGKGGKKAPKYRDPESGATWAGVGRMPAWVAAYEKEHGEGSRKDLLIAK